MATNIEVTAVPITFKTLSGLNSTSGPLGLTDNEASDLQNVEFDKFGSVLKRNGYTVLTTVPAVTTGTSQGLYWYTSLYDRKAIMVNEGKIYKIDELDGGCDDITGAVSFSEGGIDTYTNLILHFDGADEGMSFIDNSVYAKTITNLETYDSLTVLMLHANGTGGSTIITDSSLGTHTATAVGNVQIYTSKKKFGTASIYFDGIGDYLTIPDSGDWSFGTGDFTIDFWINWDSLPTSGAIQTIFAQWFNNNNNFTFDVAENAGYYKITFSVISAASTIIVVEKTSQLLNNSEWYHFALVRAGNDFQIFLNGISIATATDADAVPDFAATLFLGTYDGSSQMLKAEIDEFRVSKGIARYRSAFTPYYSQYGLVSTVTSMNKYGTAGGEFKGYENLKLADSGDWVFAEKPFTIDFWVKFNNLTGSHNNYQMFYQQEVNAGNKVNFWLDSGSHLKFLVIDTNTTKANYSCSWSPITGDWYHIGLVRTSTSLAMYINGVLQTVSTVTAVSTNSIPDLATVVYIGGDVVNNRYYVQGWMDDYRISRGVARYSASFTPRVTAYNDAIGGYSHQDFETFMGYVLGTGISNIPWQWLTSNSTSSNMAVVTGLTGAKFIKKYQNYCVMANVRINEINYPSRVYWSAYSDITSWDAADWMEISKDDGDEITGLKVLGDRLVVYKTNSIYLLFFTGDADMPFVRQKSNSAVGCIAPYSIQEAINSHIFVAYDGVYVFDGSNSYKLSDKISDTFSGLNKDELQNMVSMYQKNKNRYWLGCASGTSLRNEFVLTYNTYLNTWSKYTGISSSAMSIFMVDGNNERPYFADYGGYIYQADTGTDDYPSNSIKAINSNYYTNWKAYDDICDNKGVPHVYLVHRNESATVLTLSYAYDFYNGDQYTQTFSLFTTQTVTALTTRRDLTGRGKFVRIGFSNNQTNTSFRIDGIGTYVTKESKS